MAHLNLNRVYINQLKAVDECVNERRPVTFVTFMWGAIFVKADPTI